MENPSHELFRDLVDVCFDDRIKPLNEPSVKQYLVRLLDEFTVAERAFRIMSAERRPITTMNELLLDADPVHGTAPDFVYEWMRRKFIGDLALFFEGVYPEGLRYQPVLKSETESRLENIALESYFIASQFDELWEFSSVAPTLRLLAVRSNFDRCLHGLRLMRARFGMPRLGG